MFSSITTYIDALSNPEEGNKSSSSEESEEPLDITGLRMTAGRLEGLFQERSQGRQLNRNKTIQIAIDMEEVFQNTIAELEQLLRASGTDKFNHAYDIWRQAEAEARSQQGQEPRVEHPELLEESPIAQEMYQTMKDRTIYTSNMTRPMQQGLELLYGDSKIHDRQQRHILSMQIQFIVLRKKNRFAQRRLEELCDKIHEYQLIRRLEIIGSSRNSQS
ncbi:hypothetical protein F4678DRAFT_234470 [Xylaria arbuscula]|nr:hypothetical protein F4678DRAFT_234470 [Xylaria arbuscula]